MATRIRRKRRLAKRLIGVSFVLIPVIIVVCLVAFFKYKPTTEKYNLNDYYGLHMENQVALVVGEKILKSHGQMLDHRIFIPYQVLHEEIDDRYYWDESLQALLYTTGTEVLSYPVGEDVRMIEGEDSDSVVCVAFELIQNHTSMQCQIFASEPMRIVMDVNEKEVTTAVAKKDTQVRYRGGVKSPILAQVDKDDKVRVLEHGQDWSKVLTEDGFIGYMKKNQLGKEQSETLQLKHPLGEQDGLVPLLRDHKIKLGWHQVTAQNQNSKVYELLSGNTGLNVISPTWFYIADAAGSISSRGSKDYVDYVHGMGMEVWGLVDNFTIQELPMYQILSNASVRSHMITQLMEQAANLGLDGINVDFEDLTEESGESFVQFVRELALECHARGLVLSVDNHVPYKFNAFYNLHEQAAFADYIIMMSYDEHLNESTGAGSTASISYVKGALQRTIAQGVSENQLINAVPFYTRIWKETPENGEVRLEWNTVGMENAWTQVTEKGVQPIWDEELMQFYAEYAEGDGLCKVWLEEKESLRARLESMQEFGVAGVAGWKLGLEEDSVWDVIREYYPDET